MDNRESCGEGPLPDPPAPEMRHAAIWALQWHSRRLISVAVFCLPDRVDGKMNLFPRLLREGVAGRQSHYLHIHFLIRWCADSGVTAMFFFFPRIFHFAFCRAPPSLFDFLSSYLSDKLGEKNDSICREGWSFGWKKDDYFLTWLERIWHNSASVLGVMKPKERLHFQGPLLFRISLYQRFLTIVRISVSSATS